MPQPLPTADPNVKIPAAVKAQALRSDEVFKLVNGDANSERGNPEAAPVDTQTENKDPAQATSTPQDAAPEPQTTLQTPPAPTPEPRQVEPQKTPQGDDWERKFKSAQGRLDKSNAQIAALSEQVQNLQGMLASLQRAPKDAPAPQAETYITEEDRNTYGDEFLGVVERKAKEMVAPLKKELQDKIAQLDAKLGNVGTSVQASQRERMLSELDTQIPNWREVNTDDKFLQWLKSPDVYSGAIRHDLLRAAFEHNNTARVAAFFNGFLAEEAATVPQDQPHDQGATSQELQQTPKVSLENLAAPGRAKTAASTTAPAEKPFFTRAQIAKFYADVTAGKYHGREKQKDTLEAQIFAAQREGRIR